MQIKLVDSSGNFPLQFPCISRVYMDCFHIPRTMCYATMSVKKERLVKILNEMVVTTSG